MMDEGRVADVRKKLLNPFLFRWFLIGQLPMGFLSGMRLKRIDDEACEVSMRYRWLIKNPFNSTFWAVLGMAAEMTTGALILSYIQGQSPKVSFILVGNDAKYYKKARGRMRFVCSESAHVKQAVQLAMEDGEKHTIELPSQIHNAEGELIAEMSFTWILQRRG